MYIISPVTFFDADKELFETHIAFDDEEKQLIVSVWNKTEIGSRKLAERIIELLETPML